MDNNFLNNYAKNNNNFKDIDSNQPIKNENQSKDISSNSAMHFEEPKTFRAPPPPPPTDKKMNMKPIIYSVAGIVAIALTIILIVFLTSTSVVVPDTTGWTESDAKLWATENSVIIRTNEEFSDEIESGVVISQSPDSGETLAGGEFLELVISAGPDLSVLVEVPDIESMTATEVEAWAEENLMTKVRVLTENSQTVEAGKVISITLNDNTVLGEEIRRDSPLYVVYSSGPDENSTVELPDFRTMTVDEAELFATENKLILEIEEVYHDTMPEGTIITQSIKAEEKVQSSETIKLTVSLGKKILVPDFSQFDADTAQLKASQLGIAVTVKHIYASSSKDSFVSQSIATGTLYEGEEIVKLTYSLGNKVLLPSFVGQGKDAIENFIAPLNAEGANLSVNVTYTASAQPAGTILTQNKENVNVGVYETIYIVVSEGSVIFSPDLVANTGGTYETIVTREKAIAMCEALGITPIFVAQDTKDRLEGEVWWQSVSAGKEMSQGDTIELKYVPITSVVTVPNFDGMTEAEIRSAGYLNKFLIEFVTGEFQDGMGGKATSQSVSHGTTVAIGSVITVTIAEEIIAEIPDEIPDETPIS